MTWNHTYKLTFVVFVCFVVMAGPVFADRTLYVDSTAPPNGDGASWDTAYKYLQDALAGAQAGDEVRVAQGTYRPDRDSANPDGTGDRLTSFTLTGDMSLRGGFAGLGMPDPNAQDPNLYPTILSADLAGNDVEVDYLQYMGKQWTGEDEPTRVDNAYAVLSIEGYRVGNGLDPFPDGQELLVEGCEITGGYGTFSVAGIVSGGGADKVAVTIKDCAFYENFAVPDEFVGAPEIKWIEGCTFERNGGYYSPLTGADTVVACKFIRNYTIWGSGGGAYGAGSFIDCVFIENLAPHNGAIRTAGQSSLTRCVFIGNRALSERGGGGRLELMVL